MTEPEVAFPVPKYASSLSPPAPEHQPAFVDDQLSTVAPPVPIELGVAVRVAVTGPEGATVTVAEPETDGDGPVTLQLYMSVFTALQEPEFILHFLSGGFVQLEPTNGVWSQYAMFG